jgi:uncharacterized protein YbjQ (UPF0145 family)
MGMFDSTCKTCGVRDKTVVTHRSGPTLCPDCAVKADEHLARLARVYVSTGNPAVGYKVVQVVMEIGSGTDGWQNAFARTMQGLREMAFQLGCDGVINVKIEHRIFVESAQTFFSGVQTSQGIEFFAYGDAVKFS